MLSAPYARILEAEGFRQIGELHHRVQLTAWWNSAPDKLLQVVILIVGRNALIRADKAYHLTSVTAEGETWARDIGLLHDFLEGHFPEVRIQLSHFRDVPPELALTEVRRWMAVDAPTQPIPTVDQIALLQQQLHAKQENVRATDGMTALLDGGSDLLTGFLHADKRTTSAEIGQLQRQIDQQQQRLGVLQHLQREYQRKGSAAVYTFSIVSNLQVAHELSRFRDALRAAVKEITDANRYLVMNKLCGSRLNIQVAQSQEPAITWIEQWLGGALTPTQLRKLGPEFDALRKPAENHVIVTPDAPITVDGHVRHAEKHLAARFLSDVVRRLDKTDKSRQKAALSVETIAPEAMPLSLGYRVDDTGRMLEPVAFPLAQTVHLYASGTTGSGKSYLGRVLIEEAAQHKQLSILVLDPRNQSAGLLLPEDRPRILERYGEFKMKPDRARSFEFQYYAPGLPYVPPLPDRLSSLAKGRSIVSFKALGDEQRCSLGGAVLEAVFEACNAEESERPRLLILVDEAQLFTRKRLDEGARQAAARVERVLDRIAREGRKFGIVLALVSQTMKDFGYELASIRQMTTTKIFLRNSDREIEYASDILGDGRVLVQLPTATALVHNANWGVVRLRVRPPYSKVFELGDAELRRLIGNDGKACRALTSGAEALLRVIKENGASADQPLIMSRVAELAGVSSKRKLAELVQELENAGAIRTKQLVERGRPRVIELVRIDR
jgi:hypothetical protein